MDVLTILLFFLLGLVIGIWFGYGQGVLVGKKDGERSAMDKGKVQGIEEYLRKQIITGKPIEQGYDKADTLIDTAKENIVKSLTVPCPKPATPTGSSWFAWLLVIGAIVWAILSSD